MSEDVFGGVDYSRIRETIRDELRKGNSINRALMQILAEILEKEYRDKEALNYLRWFGWPYFGAKKHDWSFMKWEWFTYHDPDVARNYFEISGGAAVYALTLKAHRAPTQEDYKFHLISRYYWNPYVGVYVYARLRGDNNIAYVQKNFGITSPYANSRVARIWWEQNIRIRAQLWDSISYQALYPLDTDWHEVEIYMFGDRYFVFFDNKLAVYLNDYAHRVFYPVALDFNLVVNANNEAEADSYLYCNKLVVTKIGRRYIPYSTSPIAVGTSDTTIFRWYNVKVKRLILINPTAGTINFTVKDADGNEYVKKGVGAGDTAVLDVDGLLMNKIIAVADASGGYLVALLDL